MSRRSRRRFGESRNASATWGRRLRFEPLEDRRLLATLTVNTVSDITLAGDGLVTLREAIIAANTNTATDLGDVGSGADTIEFAAGATGTMTLATGEMQITEALTINGPGQDLLTIDAHQSSRIFNITATTGDFTVSGSRLIGGKTAGDGGAIRVSSFMAELTVNESTISGNSASNRGGGIAAYKLSVNNSTIQGNSVVTSNGGGIYSFNVTLTNSTISGNIGVGVYANDNGSATLNSSTVSGNSGRGISGGHVTLTGSTVSNNGGAVYGSHELILVNSTVTGDGALVFSSPNYLVTLIDSTVTGGVTGGNVSITNSSVGGGIHAQYGNVMLENATVTSGGITANGKYLEHVTVSVTNSTVSGGIGANYGSVTLTNSVSGGITVASDYGDDFVGVNLTNSTVSGSIRADYGTVRLVNSTVTGGGILTTGEFAGFVGLTNSTVSGSNSTGIRSEFGNVSINSSTVSGHAGTGIVTNAGSVTLYSSTISGNGGAGVFMSYDEYSPNPIFRATNSTISGNGITSGGGGIFTDSIPVILTNSTVSGNHSTDPGGGIYGSSVTLTNSTVSGNTSTGNGGGINAYSVSATYSTVTDNHATNSAGGGIWIRSSSVPSTIVGSIVADNSATGGNPDLRKGSGPLTVSNSLIGDNAGTSLAEAQLPDSDGNLIGSSAGGGVINPQLAPLADNGGPTWTHALPIGSPALDAIDYEVPPVPNPIADSAVHAYELNGSLADAKGGPSLVSLGGTLTSTGYQFGPNQGLNLSSAGIDPAEHSIEITFSWSELSGGWQKIVDFHDLVSDVGLYTLGNGLHFLNEAFTDNLFVANTPRHLVLTRDDTTDTVRAYVDGVQRWTFVDDDELAVFTGPDSIIRFFQDDLASGQLEARGGLVDRILVFDRVLTASEVSQLFNPPPPPPPVVPAFDQRGLPYVRVFDGDGVGGAQIDMGAFEVQPLAAFYGDYNEDGVVNSADYPVWRNTLGQTGLVPYSGADGDGDGNITPADYDLWKSHYGDVLVITLPGAGGGAGVEEDKETGRLGDKERGIGLQGRDLIAKAEGSPQRVFGLGARTDSNRSPVRAEYKFGDVHVSRPFRANNVVWALSPGLRPGLSHFALSGRHDDALLAWLSSSADANHDVDEGYVGRFGDSTGRARHGGSQATSGTDESDDDFLERFDAVFHRISGME